MRNQNWKTMTINWINWINSFPTNLCQMAPRGRKTPPKTINECHPKNVRAAQQTSAYAKSHHNTYTRILACKKSLWLLHYVKYEKETSHIPDTWTHSLSEVSYTLQNTLFYPLPSDPINTQCKFIAMDWGTFRKHSRLKYWSRGWHESG